MSSSSSTVQNSEQRLSGTNRRVFIHPSTHYVVGTTGSGKSSSVQEMIRQSDELFSEPIERVVVYLGAPDEGWKNLARADRRVKLYQHLPEPQQIEDMIKSHKGCNLAVIMDDLSTELVSCRDPQLISLFSKISSHFNTSFFVLSQFLFYSQSSGVLRNIQRNAAYLHLYANPRFISDICTISLQLMGPGYSRSFIKMYNIATDPPGGSVIALLHKRNNRKYRFVNGLSLLSGGKVKFYQLQK